MIKYRYLLLCSFSILFIFLLNVASAQVKKCAFVLDATTRQPVPFATIASLGFATYTDTTGLFWANENASEIFVISSVGYKERKFSFTQSLVCDTIFLEPSPVHLFEVEIGNHQWLRNAYTDQISLKDVRNVKFTANAIEGVTIVKYFSHPDPSKEYIISNFSFKVSQTTSVYKPRKIRLKIFAPDASNKPALDILQSVDIFTIEKPSSDYIQFDLNRYQVLAPKQGYFIGLEFLTPGIDETETGTLAICGKLSKAYENGEVFIRYFTNVFRPFSFSATQKVNVFFNTRLYEYK